MDFVAPLAVYCAPKAIAALASKIGGSKLALGITAIAPTIMSYTLYTAVVNQTPRISGLLLVPQVGFSVLGLASLGPNMYVFKNLLMPSVAGLAAYFGWVPESALPRWWVDYVKGCSVVAVAALVCLHIIHCGRAVAVRMVYPAPIIGNILDLRSMRARALNRNGVARVAVPSRVGGGVTLDTIVYRAALDGAGGASSQLGRFPSAWVVYVGGNGEVAEVSIDTVRSYAQALGAHGVVFNPRGVGESGGVPVSSAQELVDDLNDVIRWLKTEQGAAEQDIVLFAHSIGGGIASEVVAKHHPGVSLIADRTFSSLYDAARAMMPGLPEPLVRHLLPRFFGEFPSHTNFGLIPHERKAIVFHRDDQIINYNRASLARLPQFAHGEGTKYLVELSGRSTDPHNSPTEFFGTGHSEVLRRMSAFLEAAAEEKLQQGSKKTD